MVAERFVYLKSFMET